ncbi:MAG TPA: prephenate dehydrogenase [Streptosporangiaceae bacterium]|nr:prephenate dehydrogenase [Streptosporangiaceae bacterium]
MTQGPASHARAASAVVIGTGLIGTSVALALRAGGSAVWLADADPAAARLAAEMGAGAVLPPAGPEGGPADIAVLAVPPAAVAAELAAAQQRGLARCYTDVASVKELPVRRAIELGCDLSSYVPGHPLSGRERSGPAAARADLFLGRPWVICPLPENGADALWLVTGLAEACGAQPVRVSPAEHDQWVALVSHAPHVVAAAMAARLEHAAGGALALAGQGLRDVTRIAAGDPGMWRQILTANAGPAAQVLREVAAELQNAAAALDQAASGTAPDGPAADGPTAAGVAEKELAGLLERGSTGAGRIPGKRGGPARGFAVVQVIIPDRPGELARLFLAAGEAGINIEDIGIEHSAGLPVGVAELWVRPEAAEQLSAVLAAGGWPVRR